MKGEGNLFRWGRQKQPEAVPLVQAQETQEEPLNRTKQLLEADFASNSEMLHEAVDHLEEIYANLPPEIPDPDSRAVVSHIQGPGNPLLRRLSGDEQKLDAKVDAALKANIR